MGLLTDPNTGHGKYTKCLVRNCKKIYTLFYISGVIWFLCLSHKSFNNGTYFSENALLPGLVSGEFNEDLAAKKYYSELKQIMPMYPDSIPYDWLIHKFAELNIEVHLHNFSLRYPFIKDTVFHGQNLFGILRASRSSSIEGIVITASYRTLASAHPDNSASIALMLSLAKFCRKRKYWAKDIVFLVADHEQLGTQAWLEAYHDVKIGSGILNHGTVSARVGSIQAAVNLEFRSPQISYIDVKVEGVNGQLPNLDLFNLVHTLCSNEGIRHTFKNRTNPRKKDTAFEQWVHSTATLMAMVLTQASCVPNGNHGLYHRFGIEAVTLESYEPGPNYRQQVAGFHQAGRVLEGILRSLNNLLERFHQSYFFYLLPSNDRFISIGLYMPAVCLMGIPLLIKALTVWLEIYSQIQPKKTVIEEKKLKYDPPKAKGKIKETKNKNKKVDVETINLGKVIAMAHSVGWLYVKSGIWLTRFGFEFFIVKSQVSLSIGYYIYFALSVIVPAMYKLPPMKRNILNLVALIEAVTLFLTIAMHNFSLSLILCFVYVPAFISTSPKKGRLRKMFSLVHMFFIHPFVLIQLIIFAYTFVMQGGEDLFTKAWSASQHSFMYFNIDNLVYGNWFIEAVFGVLIPIWVMMWMILLSNH